MSRESSSELVLAIRPFTTGLAFVLFESALSPVDWGMRRIQGAKWNARAFAAARRLIELSKPDVVVLPEYTRTMGRSDRMRRLLDLISSHAMAESIEVGRYSRERIRECFKSAGAVTRYEIAQVIASAVHAFSHQLPPVRRIWDPENWRMYLFDAAALAMTHFGLSEKEVAEP